MLAIYGEDNADRLLMTGADAALTSGSLLGPGLPREALQRLGAAALPMQGGSSSSSPCPLDVNAAPRQKGLRGQVQKGAKRVWRSLPLRWRGRLLVIARETMQENAAGRSWPGRLARPFWLLLPAGLRARIAGRII
jgi:hypothetical protein